MYSKTLPTGIDKILWSETKIKRRVCELAAEIEQDYLKSISNKHPRYQPIVAIGILKGAFIFLSDLIRAISVPVEPDFVRVSSYSMGVNPGQLHFVHDAKTSLKERHVLIVEDIVDTGLTLSFLANEFKKRGAASIKFCALIDKTCRREKEVQLDYVGFHYSGDAFLVGYGLDYEEKYRNLIYIATLSPSAIQSSS